MTFLLSSASKDAVLQEAQILARLDHEGVVRYFNVWLETPPPGWQEDWDRRCLSPETDDSADGEWEEDDDDEEEEEEEEWYVIGSIR